MDKDPPWLDYDYSSNGAFFGKLDLLQVTSVSLSVRQRLKLMTGVPLAICRAPPFSQHYVIDLGGVTWP